MPPTAKRRRIYQPIIPTTTTSMQSSAFDSDETAKPRRPKQPVELCSHQEMMVHECYACVAGHGCFAHGQHVTRYFSSTLTPLDRKKLKMWQSERHVRTYSSGVWNKSPKRPRTNVILASLLEGFRCNYGNAWYHEESQGGACDHGHVRGLTFDTADLFNGRLQLPTRGFTVVARGQRHFPDAGAIFCYGGDGNAGSDKFCALFEDGRYFVCDDFGRSILGDKWNSYRERLKWLAGLLLEAKRNAANEAPNAAASVASDY